LDSNGRAWASEHDYLKNLGLGWVVAGDLDHLPAFLVGKGITQHEQVETPPRRVRRSISSLPTIKICAFDFMGVSLARVERHHVEKP
jgi:hypothetical protein